MDSKISEFLNEGNIHPTRKSHRNAAKSYFTYLFCFHISPTYIYRVECYFFLDLFYVFLILFFECVDIFKGQFFSTCAMDRRLSTQN